MPLVSETLTTAGEALLLIVLLFSLVILTVSVFSDVF